MDTIKLSSRKARIDTEINDKQYRDINLSTGDLDVAGRLTKTGLVQRKRCAF